MAFIKGGVFIYILILVYVGAVMVLFLFVVMMLDINITQAKEGFVKYMPIGVLIFFVIDLPKVKLLLTKPFFCKKIIGNNYIMTSLYS